MYCSGSCLPPEPKPKNLWHWFRKELGLQFRTVDNTLMRYS